MVREGEGGAAVVLVATGSEVALACAAADELREQDVSARVVSCPSLELFQAQPEAYQLSVVPRRGPPVVAVEALRGESLRVLAGSDGLVYGIDRFGASAPAPVLAEAYGFTPKRLAERVLGHLRR